MNDGLKQFKEKLKTQNYNNIFETKHWHSCKLIPGNFNKAEIPPIIQKICMISLTKQMKFAIFLLRCLHQWEMWITADSWSTQLHFITYFLYYVIYLSITSNLSLCVWIRIPLLNCFDDFIKGSHSICITLKSSNKFYLFSHI